MKIFGIGLSKTGTTSLASALELLGYRTRDYPGLARYAPGDLATLDAAVLDSHDALTDTPIPSLYRELDARYPGSKFILTVRDIDGWLKSCKKQFTEKHAANLSEAHHRLFMDLYGSTVFDEALFRQGYARFVDGVSAHFRERPADLLILDVTAGEGWEKLCPFLGKPAPELPFPKANVTQIRWMKIADVIAIAREAGALAPASARPRARGPGLAAVGRALLARWLGTVRGGRAGARQATRESVERHLVRRLAALNAQIPVISPHSAVALGGDASRLNHFWLVDPWAQGTMSIALIEDQKPIYGVVYTPASDTVYYASRGKGAFKLQGGAAVRLGAHGASLPPAAAPNAETGSPALTLCHVAEGTARSSPLLRNAREWQTAAGDAVLRAVGLRLVHCATQDPLAYQNTDLGHDCLVVG
jgi:hypothetical protein